MNDWFPTVRKLLPPLGFRRIWPWYTTAAQRQALLRLIAVATEENLPLPPLITAWAEDEAGVQRSRLLRLARLLAEGRPLPAAIEEVPGVLLEEDLLALRFDTQSGTRTAAIRAALAQPPLASTRAVQRLWRACLYASVMLPLGLLVLVFGRIKIVPVLDKIFAEFGMPPPPGLVWSSAWFDALSRVWWLIALAAIATAGWLLATHRGRRVRRWLVGFTFRPLRESRAADVLQHLSVAAAAGRPLPGALSTLARYHFDPAIRRELLFVRNEVEQGADVWQSMQAAGLLAPREAHLLRVSEQAHRAWALQQLVDAKRRRTLRALDRAAELVLPAFVLLMSAMVLFQAFTILDPLRRLIEGLL